MNRQYRVMVVEDEQIILKDIVNEIKKLDLGFDEIFEASNGRDAFNYFCVHKPDLIITDIKMPVLDGLSLIEEIRMIDKDVPIIILSGYNEFDYAKKALKYDVEDYLLKPIEVDLLEKTLLEIIAKVNRNRMKDEQDDLIAALHEAPSLNHNFGDSELIVYCVGVGNLYNHVISKDTLKLWSAIDLNEVLNKAKISKRWILNARVPNKRYIVIDCHFESVEEVMKRVNDVLIEWISNNTLNIIYWHKAIGIHDLNRITKNLSNVLDMNQVIGHSQIICVDSHTCQKSMNKVERHIIKKFKEMVDKKSSEGIKNALFEFVKSSSENCLSQLRVESTLLYFVKYVYQSYQANLDLIEAELRIRKILYHAKNLYTTRFKIWNVISEGISEIDITKVSSEEVVYYIEDYMRRHFNEDVALDELARRFNFSSTYLTRIFKKFKGESPMKFLIQLRIDEAIKLIVSNPEMDIKDIAERVGYFDSHYFSRIFKRKVGQTPSEYRVKNVQKNPLG